MKDWELKFIEDMRSLAADSEVFARIVEFEFDGTVASTNSPESLVRNAMVTRWNVYAQCFPDSCDTAQEEWEKDISSNDFYAVAFK